MIRERAQLAPPVQVKELVVADIVAVETEFDLGARAHRPGLRGERRDRLDECGF